MEIGIITIGSDPDCDDMPVSGTRARLILINYSDIDRMLFSDDGRVLAVEMKAGKVGYEFLGFRADMKKADEAVKRDKSKQRFKHALSFVVYEVDQVQKNNIVNMVKGRFVAIIENRGKGNDSIEVLGRECGLAIIDGQIRNAYEHGGLFVINLATPDNGIEFERKLPQSLGVDYEDGLSIIEDILFPLGPLTIDSTVDTIDNTLITIDQTYY